MLIGQGTNTFHRLIVSRPGKREQKAWCLSSLFIAQKNKGKIMKLFGWRRVQTPTRYYSYIPVTQLDNDRPSRDQGTVDSQNQPQCSDDTSSSRQESSDR